MPDGPFRGFFEQATEKEPCTYQEKLAAAPIESRLIHVPTGCGKTTLLKKPPEMSPLRAAKGSALFVFNEKQQILAPFSMTDAPF